MRVQRVATQHKATPQTPPDPVLRCANPGCGLEFIPRRKWQKFHSSSCRFRHWNRRQRSAKSVSNQARPSPKPTVAQRGKLGLTIQCVMELSWATMDAELVGNRHQ